MNAPKSSLVAWLDRRLPIVSAFRREYIDYPMPRNLNALWNFGAFATVALALLLLSGIFLALNYTPTVARAFASIETIDRDVASGWFVRAVYGWRHDAVRIALHSSGARSLLWLL